MVRGGPFRHRATAGLRGSPAHESRDDLFLLERLRRGAMPQRPALPNQWHIRAGPAPEPTARRHLPGTSRPAVGGRRVGAGHHGSLQFR